MLQHPVADAILARVTEHLRRVPGAAAALPAFDRTTGAGVLRSLTIRTAPAGPARHCPPRHRYAF